MSDAATSPTPPDPTEPPAAPSASDPSTVRQRPVSVDELPPYSRSLLRIKIPIVAVLAGRKQRLEDILDLGPGAIIQFDKSCEQLLDLRAGNQPVARGEAVKVGEKFGLRIQEVTLPTERFKSVQ